ncbi:hypothetical protein KSP40_PGU000140 [Platanthera guangdongensis]|uniref:Glucosidase II beta subunit N-terminal domain-containing protein n=1 Tax=Platanthera guangdongensis TaxID=2320717 RepID=A0ABR2M729_9ASPA
MQLVARRRLFFAAVVLACFLFASTAPPLRPPFTGISPQDEKYYSGAIIACSDGSKTFPHNHLNDGYCDCPDGTDEPGTSACPESKFYCRNIGDVPQQLFSSRVNDGICDCCDGSDEYDVDITCQNTCAKNKDSDLSMGDGYHSTEARIDDLRVRQKRRRVDLNDLLHYLEGMWIISIIELVILMVVLTIVIRRTRSRRRLHLWRNE